jgi:hypothetical protein
VRSRTRQLVLLFGILESLANTGPLCASLISLSATDDGTPVICESWDAPSQTEKLPIPQASLLADSLLSRATDDVTPQYPAGSLCRGSREDVLPTGPGPTNASVPSGPPGNDDAPSPKPAAPSGGGVTGTTGFAQGGPKVEQDGLVNWSNPRFSEMHEAATSHHSQTTPDAPLFGIFRPPR